MKKLLSLPPVSFVLDVADLYGRAGVSRSAAALSYFLILTLFPLLVCVNYFIGLFHLDLEQLLQSLDQLLPPGALTILADYLGYVSEIQSPALLLASLFTILISASAGLDVYKRQFLWCTALYRNGRPASVPPCSYGEWGISLP